MPAETTRSVRTLLLAAAAFACGVPMPSRAAAPGALPEGSAADAGAGASAVVLAASADDAAGRAGDVLSRAAELLSRGKLLRAKALLLNASSAAAGASMTDAEQGRAFRLLREIEAAISSAAPASLAVQRAELAVVQDDLVTAEREARAAVAAAPEGSADAVAATALLAVVESRREALAPVLPAWLAAAGEAFDAGRYEDAKSILGGLALVGGSMGEAESAMLADLRGRLGELESMNGRSFAAEPLALSMMQPGVVERRPWPAAPGESRRGTARPGQPAEPATGQPGQAEPPSGTPDYQPITGDGSQPAATPGATPESNPYIRYVGDPAASSLSPVPTGGQVPTAAPTAPTAPAATPVAPAAPATGGTDAAAGLGAAPAAVPAAGGVVDQAIAQEAARLLAMADVAYQQRRLGEAEQLYGELLAGYRAGLTGDQAATAQQRLADVQLELREGLIDPNRALSDEIDRRGLARQQTLAQFENEFSQSQAALESGDFVRARDMAAVARLTVNRGREVLSATEFEELQGRADDLVSRIAETEEAERIRTAQSREAELERKRTEAESDRLRQRDAKIAELLDRVRSLQLEQNYEKALQEVDQILFLDPLNPAGLLLRDVLRDTILYRRYSETTEDIRRSHAEELVTNLQAVIAPRSLIEYPEDWRAISIRRGDPLQFTDTPTNRATLAKLSDRRIPVSFEENNFEDVLKFVASVGDLEMDIDWESLEDIGVDPESTVSLKLTNVPLQTVLDRVLEKASDPEVPAGWAVYDGVLTIASDEVLRRNTVLEIYDIRDLLIEVPDYDNAPDFDLQSAFQNSGQQGGGGGGQSPFQQNDQEDADRIPREELIERIVDLIQENVDPEGWQDTGGDTGTIQELNGNLIITNTPKNHRAIIGLLGKLRSVRNMQINVESRFLLVNEAYFEQIGFDIDVFLNADSSEYRTLSTVDPSLLPSDFFGRTPGGQAVINRSVQGAPIIDTDGNGIPDLPISQPVFAPGQQSDEFSVIQGAQNSFGLTESLAGGTGFAGEILSASGGPALSVAGRFLDDIQVDFLVEATQADRRSVALTAPRLTLTNGQRANVFVATQQAFVSDLTPVVSDAAVSFDPVIGVVPSGVVLDVDGVISADRRYVTINVTTQISEVTLIPSTTFTAVAGGAGIGGGGATVPAQGQVQLPTTTITSVSTTVTVPDQGTILLGGQRLVDEIETETGVPVLSKIPILNRFFSNRIESREERTLLILLKPTILIQNEEEEKNFPGLLDSLGG